jgi:hypothetical protein
MIMKNLLNEFSLRTNTFHKVSQMKSVVHWCNWKAICLLLMVFGGRSVVGQVVITTAGTAYSQDFNALGSSAAASIPSAFVVCLYSSSPTWTSGSNFTQYAAGSSGTGIITSTSAGGIYNLANGITGSSGDRALGFLTSGSTQTNSSYVIFKFNNQTGGIINQINVSFDYEKYRSGSRAFNWTFFHGPSENPNILEASGGQSYPADVNNTTIYNPPTSTNKNFTISNLTISNNQDYYLKWMYSPNPATGSSNGQAIGIDNFTIKATSIMSNSGLTSVSNLNIPIGTTYTVPSGSQLTVTGTLTNDGTLTIESGATLVQGATSTLAGTGTYNVKQTVTGGNDGTNPNSRFWYIGSPVSLSSSSVLFLGTNPVVKKRDEVNNTWITLTSTPEDLEVGRGYYMRTSLSSPTINFTGGVINNNPTASALTLNLTRTANSFAGFNLVCNPYPSYLDWDLVTKNQVENTIWYRTADNTNTMVFETYVSGAANGIGTSISGNTATKLIPPMQSFWVRVSPTFTSGSITLNNSMRSHFASYGNSTAGLRSTVNDFNLFLRMNLVQEDKKDQIIVYVNENSSNQYDAFDGEKMMQVDRPQFYTTASGKKIVINGLSAEDTQQSLPITMELTTTGTHQFMVEDLEIAAGNVWLEDKLKETYQLLEPGFGYKFFAYAGLTDDRFVLHLKLKDANSPSTPNFDAANEMAANHANVYSEGAGVVVIKLPTTDDVATDVQIYDAAGRTFFSGTLKSLETKIQLEQAKGIYYISLTSVNGVEVRKVFIQ